MRKESATIRKCHSRLSSLGLDSTVAFHKSKLILKIYRDVVWVLSERAQELQEYAWELGNQDLSTGLCYRGRDCYGGTSSGLQQDARRFR